MQKKGIKAIYIIYTSMFFISIAHAIATVYVFLNIGDIEDTQRDEFEFLDVTCYMSHSCAANPVVLKNKGIEQDNDAVQLMELRYY